MEHFEYMDTIFTEYAEWLNYEADMATDPYGSEWPPEETPEWLEHLDQMEKIMG